MFTQVGVYKAGKRTPYWIEDPRARVYLDFLRKISRGVSIADAAEQTIGLSRAKQTISFHSDGKPLEEYHYSITIRGRVILREELVRGVKTIFRRDGTHTVIHNATPIDLPVSHTALAAIAWYTPECREVREKMFDCV